MSSKKVARIAKRQMKRERVRGENREARLDMRSDRVGERVERRRKRRGERIERRKKRRKKIRLAFKKLGEGALKVLKNPVFKSAMGLISGKALEAATTQMPQLEVVKDPLKDAVKEGLDVLDHVGDKEAVKKQAKKMLPPLKEALQKSLDFVKSTQST